MARPPIIKLTSKYILDNINQEDIFSVYFNIPASHISAIVNTNKKISAPYRSDKDPSFGFIYRSNGKLIGRDFGGYFWGDCFDCVGFVLGLNANIKSDFGKIMEHIIKTFRLNKYQNTASTFSYIRKEIEIKEKPVLKSPLVRNILGILNSLRRCLAIALPVLSKSMKLKTLVHLLLI